MTKLTPEAWQGDGLPEDDDDALDCINELDLFTHELEALIEANKSEAWVREKAAKYEDHADNTLLAQFFWRRVERWRELAKAYAEEIKKANNKGETK